MLGAEPEDGKVAKRFGSKALPLPDAELERRPWLQSVGSVGATLSLASTWSPRGNTSFQDVFLGHAFNTRPPRHSDALGPK